MRNVVYVINTIVKGGPSNVVLGLINCIDRNKYNPILLTLFDGNDEGIIDQLRSQGISVIECYNKNRMKYLIKGHKEFGRIIGKLKADVIHSHGFVPDIVSAQISTTAKRISTIHNIMFDDYAYTYGKIKSKIYTVFHLCALRRLDLAVCCAKSVYEVMVKYLNNTTYIRNGSKKIISNKCNRTELGIPENSKVFVYVGHLNSRKRTEYLVNSFHQYRNDSEYLLLIGEGEEKSRCESVDDDHIIFLGFQNNPYKYMKMSDIYISASAAEGFSISVIEALDCGLGVFLSNIPSHTELFEIDDGIYLGETFCEDDFRMKLQALRKQYAQLERNKIMMFKDTYLSSEAMTEQYQNLY